MGKLREDEIHLAAEKNDIATCEHIYAENPLCINQLKVFLPFNNTTPLFWAAKAGNIEAVRWFLSRGAQIIPTSGFIPLAWATTEVKDLLLPLTIKEAQKYGIVDPSLSSDQVYDTFRLLSRLSHTVDSEDIVKPDIFLETVINYIPLIDDLSKRTAFLIAVCCCMQEDDPKHKELTEQIFKLCDEITCPDANISQQFARLCDMRLVSEEIDQYYLRALQFDDRQNIQYTVELLFHYASNLIWNDSPDIAMNIQRADDAYSLMKKMDPNLIGDSLCHAIKRYCGMLGSCNQSSTALKYMELLLELLQKQQRPTIHRQTSLSIELVCLYLSAGLTEKADILFNSTQPFILETLNLTFQQVGDNGPYKPYLKYVDNLLQRKAYTTAIPILQLLKQSKPSSGQEISVERVAIQKKLFKCFVNLGRNAEAAQEFKELKSIANSECDTHDEAQFSKSRTINDVCVLVAWYFSDRKHESNNKQTAESYYRKALELGMGMRNQNGLLTCSHHLTSSISTTLDALANHYKSCGDGEFNDFYALLALLAKKIMKISLPGNQKNNERISVIMLMFYQQANKVVKSGDISTILYYSVFADILCKTYLENRTDFKDSFVIAKPKEYFCSDDFYSDDFHQAEIQTHFNNEAEARCLLFHAYELRKAARAGLSIKPLSNYLAPNPIIMTTILQNQQILEDKNKELEAKNSKLEDQINRLEAVLNSMVANLPLLNNDSSNAPLEKSNKRQRGDSDTLNPENLPSLHPPVSSYHPGMWEQPTKTANLDDGSPKLASQLNC